MLHHVTTMGGINISFLVEADKHTAPFTHTAERTFQARLENMDTATSGVTIQTMVNGKITASDYFLTKVITDEQENIES